MTDPHQFNDAEDRRLFFCTAWDLNEATRRHLYDATVMLWDELQDIVDHVIRTVEQGRPQPPLHELYYLSDYLPAAYAASYTPHFYSDFMQALSSVIYKLGAGTWGDGTLLSCVAEELAMNAILRFAEGYIDIRRDTDDDTSDLDEVDFHFLWEVCFQDHDFKVLFHPETDGIQDSSVGQAMGMGFLDPSEWFDSFLNAGMLPHPLTWQRYEHQ
jgi:hypothetical protein